MSAYALFVADVHLSETRPEAVARFLSFLDTTARLATDLYVLGDLFEVWVGDDDLESALAQSVARHMRGLGLHGVRVFFMHGNRDFLLARRYAELCGMTLLADPVTILLGDTETLLTHGDMLCTDDIDYQRFRRVLRRPLVTKALRSLPLPLRRFLARRARARSENAKRQKDQCIMDVSSGAVLEAFRRHRVNRIIHGHTHRPGRHILEDGGKKCERWVLPDWYDDRGGYLRCDAQSCQLVTDGSTFDADPLP